MSDYTLTQTEFTSLKRKLTIAKKKGPQAVIKACDEALAIFVQKGYPDSWSDWERAHDDAQFELNRNRSTW